MVDPLTNRHPVERPPAALSGQRTTLAAVARSTGVSISTVSKVINGRSGVSTATRERVEASLNELGYVSLGARQGSLLLSGESSIDVVVDPHDISNPYLSTFLGGAMEAAGELHAAILLRSIDNVAEAHPATWAQDIARAGRAGVVEVTSRYSPERERALKQAGIPMVLVDPIDLPRTSTPSVGATNWAGGYSATQHLIDLGHRRIRYIGGPPGAHCDVVRAHGWAAAMAEAGLEASLDAVPRGAYTFEHGLAAATQLLTLNERPTGIFAGSDTTAMGVIEAARRLGIEVPGQLSVVGFDDTLLARMSAPPLTTVHQPIADIAQTAIQTVLRLARGETLKTRRVELATHLVIRDSTNPPNT
ncbi:LacI family DNA-binding transcriptional regulator [Tessaracoccus lubricantis]|uniref:LacI family DNA-binding transcriptional regulator n=1 Tax=Tessaracoccus lubricantis TaxID=545543 RepID=A0ABP9FK98_9ACTN